MSKPSRRGFFGLFAAAAAMPVLDVAAVSPSVVNEAARVEMMKWRGLNATTTWADGCHTHGTIAPGGDASHTHRINTHV